MYLKSISILTKFQILGEYLRIFHLATEKPSELQIVDAPQVEPLLFADITKHYEEI